MYGTVLTKNVKYNRILGQCRVLFGDMMIREPRVRGLIQDQSPERRELSQSVEVTFPPLDSVTDRSVKFTLSAIDPDIPISFMVAQGSC
jgi:hypothetical protein